MPNRIVEGGHLSPSRNCCSWPACAFPLYSPANLLECRGFDVLHCKFIAKRFFLVASSAVPDKKRVRRWSVDWYSCVSQNKACTARARSAAV